MTAQIIQFVPRPNPNRDRQWLEQQALELMQLALMGEPGPCGFEPVVFIEIPDTSPSEVNPDQPA